ncbi:AAA family ATPase [Muricoccus nepalensis]|nr:AAA family ATPase [Roseomonas nepalensis]
MDGYQKTPEELLEEVGATGTRHTPKFWARSFNDCRLDHASSYYVKGILAPGDLALIFGQPGCGKSLLGPLMAYALADGRRVFGRRTRKCRVLYIAAEAGADMEVRLVALRKRYGAVNGLHMIAVPMDLQNLDCRDLKELRAEIKRLQPDVIFVDTIAAAFPGMEENEARDMGKAVRTLRSLADEAERGAPKPAVVAIHHAPKEGLTPRGHGLLNGDCDVTMRVEGQDDQPRRVTFGKNRNGPSGHAFDFGICLEELGIDEDGDAIRRPVAVELDQEEAKKPKGKPLNESQAGWLRDLHNLFAEPGLASTRVPLPDMRGVLTLTRDQVRVGLRGVGKFELDQDGNLTAKDRDRMREALNALKDRGKIGLTADLVWLL